tara:strand:+ start:7348 stop:7809 length:462 start_codon:yes stop_codon:yes gene_type:complete
MELRVRETGEVISERDLHYKYPNISFPKPLSLYVLDTYGLDAILEGPKPQTTPPYETVIRQGIEEIDGKWFKKYAIGPIFNNEEDKKSYKLKIDTKASEDIRKTRNNLISESDWMGCSDVIMSDEWKEYRQALRDIPEQEGFPHSVDWPTQPS